jgi:hypothetical protein
MRPLLDVELAALLPLLDTMGPGVVNVGHGRDPESVRRARSFGEAWTARGGLLGMVVSWPPVAASWLRPATRLAAAADLWVVADTAAGWAGIGPRLATTARWRPDRTVAFPGLDDPGLARLAGHAAVAGLRGVTVDGRTWTHDGRWVRITGAPIREPA